MSAETCLTCSGSGVVWTGEAVAGVRPNRVCPACHGWGLVWQAGEVSA
ncbi:hypothetical protein [Sulfobacillus harzensis]|uniref:Chaperone protein DnaJ n=1 Tax=Sulfobacillus harzensis TaxID=2729629 RepID=A0A7Y0L3S2_9FIRM|nr:hypothetical protein [Sulfobacillus harzensis]NMP21870.1 hypothetical protein [Sulfobacillus harzensis]